MTRTLLAALGILASAMAAYSADVNVSDRTFAIKTVPTFYRGVPLIFFQSHFSSTRTELRRILLERSSGSFLKTEELAVLPPMMAGGRDISLASMIDIIWQNHRNEDILCLTAQDSFPYLNFQHTLNICRPSAAGLPCFDNDYDRTMAKTQELYAVCKEYYVTRYVMSLEVPDRCVVF